jgi:hypothetical protein
VILIDKLLAGGIGFVLRRVVDAADAEMNDEGALRDRLMESEMKLELGEMDEHEFRAIESDVLARMREMRERHDAERGERDAWGRAGRWEKDAVEAVIYAEAEQPREEQKPRPRRARPKRGRQG